VSVQQVVAVDPLKVVWKWQRSLLNLEYMASGGGATELYVRTPKKAFLPDYRI
jgi:hypothetical protein